MDDRRSNTKNRSLTCGPFQFFFYDSLLVPDENSKIQSNKKLKRGAIETLLNEIFTLDREQNENIIKNYMNNKNNADMNHSDCSVPISNLSLFKIVGFGQVQPSVMKKKMTKRQ